MLSALGLFTGAGGLDLGIEGAGFTTLFATDCDDRCVATLERNRGRTLGPHPGRAFLERDSIQRADVREVRWEEIAVQVGGPVDLVFGGPPCQAFSSAGRMGSVRDPRGLLVFEFARAVDALRPRAFVMENVRGLVTARDSDGTPGGVLHALIETFCDLGYSVHAFLLNAADYGSYRRRVRCFVVGVRGGRVVPIPEATHGHPARP